MAYLACDKDGTEWVCSRSCSTCAINKRNKKTWLNFYKLFPRYKDIMLESLKGERKAIVKEECVIVKISHHHNFSQILK